MKLDEIHVFNDCLPSNVKTLISNIPDNVRVVAHFFDADTDTSYDDCNLRIEYCEDENTLYFNMSYEELECIHSEHWWYADDVHATKLTYSNGNTKYIFVIPGDMIFVADFDYAELSKRTEVGDIDSYEAYDLSDGCAYFLKSKYAEAISDTLLHMISTYERRRS